MQSEGSKALNRRQMLRLGAAGAGGLLLSGAASSQVLTSSILTKPTIDPLSPAPAPAAPATFTAPGGINPALFSKAKAALDSRNWIQHRDFIGIAENQWDFTDPASIPGFGPLQEHDDVAKLVAQAMGKLEERLTP